MKIGHISDLHILSLPDRWEMLKTPWKFANKRLVGGANLLFRRADSHQPRLVHMALDHLEECDVDHIAITGDLSNLAMDTEFEAAAEILGDIRDSEERVSVIPGNHDYYTRQAAHSGKFERYFARYLESDLPAYQQASGYPFCHLRGDVAIIGLNSGIPTPWFFATGRVDEDELRAAGALLDDPKVRDRFKIVMIHHHLLPFEYSRVEYNRRLINADAVLEMLRSREVDLAIHGHNHHFSTIALPHLRGPGTLRICEAGSTSLAHYKNPFFGGKFNIYHIEGGRLRKIETHLFETEEKSTNGGTFIPWKEQTFEEEVPA